MPTDVAKEKKQHKLTEAEYQSFPAWVKAYPESGYALPTKFITDYRKKNPAQPTRADSTFRPVTDKYGKPTGETIGFNINEAVDKRALRRFDVAEAKKEVPKKDRPPKTAQEAYQRKIAGFTGDIGKLSETAKRLEDIGIEAEPITQQIDALSDSIRVTSKRFKAKKKSNLISGITKLTSEDKKTLVTVRTNINASLRAGVSIDRIKEMIKDNWGMTLEEFNTIYKNNQ